MVYTAPDEVPWSAYVAVGAIFLVVLAALLTWHTTDGVPQTGIQTHDGNVTAGVTLAALGLIIAYEWGLVAQLGATIAGLVTVWIGTDIWLQVDGASELQPQVGLYLTTLAGVLLVIVAIYSLAVEYWPSDGSRGAIGRILQ